MNGSDHLWVAGRGVRTKLRWETVLTGMVPHTHRHTHTHDLLSHFLGHWI